MRQGPAAKRPARRLMDRTWASPGIYSITWDGSDDQGHPLPAGIYFYRLETERGVQTARVVRIR